ncbi:MAG: 50S ribosomal protein L18 [Alphaproteobacteria bacterium]|nr:50S ribosomal protein L18 [Alphaproteobacteria bacterium]NCB50006.1 50S ribosomal protein L18 [Alphaproteobacteria bacterium]
MKSSNIQFERRKRRTRYAISQKASGRARLSIFRSEKNIYAQIIDDSIGKTLASASSLEKELKAKGSTVAGAEIIGKAVAERALKAGVKEVVFDRGGYIYHGRVKALADAARKTGLSF